MKLNNQIKITLRLLFVVSLIFLMNCSTFKNKEQVSSTSLSLENETYQTRLLKTKPIQVKWVHDLKGDFSFVSNWSYNEGIYKNEFGQLSCDGFCPERVDKMKDENGRIIKDSIPIFYHLIDTTHQFHTINSKIDNEEESYVNFIKLNRVNDSIISLKTTQNSHIYGGLNMLITNSKCYSQVEVISPNSKIGTTYYNLTNGEISIDIDSYHNNILKSYFDFTFTNKNNIIKWSGNIYISI